MKSRRKKYCGRCGSTNEARARKCRTCTEPLTRPRWVMSKERIKAVHTKARSQKGLDEEAYRLRLQRLGIESCKEMKRRHFAAFMRELDELPDVPGWRRG